MKKMIQTLILILCIGIFVFSAWKLYGIWQEYHEGDKIYDSIQAQVALPDSSDTNSESSQPDAESGEGDIYIPDALVDLEKLKDINSDAVGWIQIPDTTIDYPILQGKDNEQYLHHTITGEYNKAGCIFVESGIEQPFHEANTIVYGHNLLNGKMFSNLTMYEEKEWYQEHPYIYIQMEEGVQVYEVYSCYRTTDGSSTYTFGMENNTEVFLNYLEETQKHALYQTDIIPDGSDRILTLSTCTNDEEGERFAVHARLLNP